MTYRRKDLNEPTHSRGWDFDFLCSLALIHTTLKAEENEGVF